MGQNKVLVYGLVLLMIVGILVSFPAIRDYISQFLQQYISGTQVTGPYLPGRDSDKQVCGLCHSDKSRDFNKKYQHAPFANWYCTDCHVPHNVGTGKHEYVVDLDRLCFTCHFNKLDTKTYKYQHKPYEMGHCVDCHDPHASDYEHILRTSPQTLCTTCHKMGGVFELPYKHKPYEQGLCADCHQPHASQYRGMTKLPGKQLCYSCHYDRKNELRLPVQHKPYEQGDCVNCHGAHATSAPKLVLVPGNKLCLTCHVGLGQKMKNGYVHDPVQQKCTNCHVPHASKKPSLLPKSGTDLCYSCHTRIKSDFENSQSHHPVENGLLDCSGCHDPHVGKGKNLELKAGNELCYTCHLGLKETYEQLKHATKAKGKGGTGACTNCHVPHGSAWKPLLFNDQETVCASCHTSVYKASYNHPVGAQFTDAWHGGSMHCSSCHGPHGTNKVNFLLLTKDGLCLKCHGKKIPDTEEWDIHSTIPPRNEKKDSGITTKILSEYNNNKTSAVNKRVK